MLFGHQAADDVTTPAQRDLDGGLPPRPLRGTVTLRYRKREASATQELSGLCDRVPPRGHRRSAKRTVGLG